MRYKLPYGLKDGQLLHISEVDKGLKCQCVCPGCGHPLIARKGPKTVHHFAHAQHGDCAKGMETALHLAAKEILQKHKRMQLPKVEIEFNSYRLNWLVSEESAIQFDEVRLEYRMDSIIPDVLVMVKGRPLMIEITVTHKTERPKIEKIKEMSISCLEIDLSRIGELTVQEIENVIIEEVANKNWLHNEKAALYKKKALSFAVRKRTFQRGMALHVDACPIRTRVYHGKPYANVIDDCLSSCVYCLQVGEGDSDEESERYGSMDEIHCTGAKGIKDLKDILILKPSSK